MNITETEKLVTNLLRRVITRMILHPEDLVISTRLSQTSINLKLQAQVSDTGKIIGERGSMFNALKAICLTMGQRYGVTILLGRIEEPEDGQKDEFTRFKLNDQWKYEFETVDRQLLELVCTHTFKGDSTVTSSEIGKGETQFDILVARDEQARPCQAMQESLQTIFTAIGKAQGRLIYITINPGLAATGPGQQPVTSRGRFA
jgi:predicted RNA-binding protein YlqC (UPF0109 family)